MPRRNRGPTRGQPRRAARRPRRRRCRAAASVAIVGDSQAHSLAINLPDGIETTFAFTDGASAGAASTSGRVVHRPRRRSATTSASAGAGRQSGPTPRAAAPTSRSSCSARGTCSTSTSATAVDRVRHDRVRRLRSAAAADRASTRSAVAGADVALLEVPCMRPHDVEGAGVPALPERGDDAAGGARQRRCCASWPRRDPDHARSSTARDDGATTRRSPPTSATAGTACTPTSPGANLIYETIARAHCSPIPIGAR